MGSTALGRVDVPIGVRCCLIRSQSTRQSHFVGGNCVFKRHLWIPAHRAVLAVETEAAKHQHSDKDEPKQTEDELNWHAGKWVLALWFRVWGGCGGCDGGEGWELIA